MYKIYTYNYGSKNNDTDLRQSHHHRPPFVERWPVFTDSDSVISERWPVFPDRDSVISISKQKLVLVWNLIIFYQRILLLILSIFVLSACDIRPLIRVHL